MNSTELTNVIEEEDILAVKSLAKKYRLRKKLITFGVIAIAFILAVSAAWIAGRVQAKQKSEERIAQLIAEVEAKENELQELINAPIVVSPVAPEISLDIIYSEIQNIGELASVEYMFTDAARYSDSKQIKEWNIPFTEKSFILKWDGSIKAGIKLDGVVIDVDEDEGKLLVHVPKAEILSYEVDDESVEILDEKNNIFNKLSVDDKIEFDAKTKEAMIERAIENGLLEKAQANAEDILYRLLVANPAIADAYKVEFIVSE